MPGVEPNILAGTWEEIRGYESRLAGHRVRVTILDLDDTPAVRVDEKFAALAAPWRAETAWTSSVSQMAMHPAYQEIIGMGRDVISARLRRRRERSDLPYLLRELERQPEHWFWALRAITGADPVRPEPRGQVAAMAQSWLQWGQEHGYHRSPANPAARRDHSQRVRCWRSRG